MQAWKGSDTGGGGGTEGMRDSHPHRRRPPSLSLMSRPHLDEVIKVNTTREQGQQG